ncbi:hypothetical protein ACWD9K_37660 [Streptomyces sp. 900116325]
MALTLAGGVAVYFGTYGLDRATTKDRVRADKAAEESLDHERAPFVSKVTPSDYAEYMPDGVRFVLDRPLTKGEQARLTATRGTGAKVWALLEPWGGRVVESPQQFKPEGGADGQMTGLGPATQPVRLNLNSDRTAGLTINGMMAVKDACAAPAAKTVIDLPRAGTFPLPGVWWDLADGVGDKPSGPFVLDEGDDNGKMFFRTNAIDLGNGQQNAALRIEPVVTSQTCTWHIEASYTDVSGAYTVRIPSGTQTITTEALPLKPVQFFRWIVGAGGGGKGGWGCRGQMSQNGCTATKTLERFP